MDAQERQLMRHISLAKGLSKIVALSSVYIPLSNPPLSIPPTITLERNYPWHTAALLTTAIETSTLRTRLRPGDGWFSMNELSSFITRGTGRSLSLLSLGIGRLKQHAEPILANPVTNDSIIDCSWRGSPHLSRKTHTFSEVRMTRGAEPDLDIADASGSMQQGVSVTTRCVRRAGFLSLFLWPRTWCLATICC